MADYCYSANSSANANSRMINKDNHILVTGAAGFIGAALVIKLLENGEKVIGIDNINSYYDPSLKLERLKNIKEKSTENNWSFYKISLEDKDSLADLFTKYKPKIVINLAAQAGVRYSLENPYSYIQSNLVGFANLLEACRNFNVENLIYASSSSVYGGNKSLPFDEHQSVDHPVSLYAATKKSNELMAHSYSHLFGIPSTGLRFFTVYGPWGRPDMAPMIFAKCISEKLPIKVFNYGKMKRDFTYIEDIVEGISRCCYKPATPNESYNVLSPDPATSTAPHRIFNIGNSQPIELMVFIGLLENAFSIKAIKDFQPIQAGDVEVTAAKTDLLFDWINYKPKTSINEGIEHFSNWFKSFY